jgi:hypothetical protein
MDRRRVLIVGGGIAGLALAPMLARTGVEVEVAERERAWRPTGTPRCSRRDGRRVRGFPCGRTPTTDASSRVIVRRDAECSSRCPPPGSPPGKHRESSRALTASHDDDTSAAAPEGERAGRLRRFETDDFRPSSRASCVLRLALERARRISSQGITRRVQPGRPLRRYAGATPGGSPSQSCEGRHVTHLAVLRGGLELPYVVKGDPEGIPVVLLHARLDSLRCFDQLMTGLPERIRAFAFDQRGHGDAAKPAGEYELRDFADDVGAFMDAVGLDAAVLVGASSGGYVAQRFAVDKPARTLGIALLGGSATRQRETLLARSDPGAGLVERLAAAASIRPPCRAPGRRGRCVCTSRRRRRARPGSRRPQDRGHHRRR